MAISVSPQDILQDTNNPLLQGNPTWRRMKVSEFAKVQNGFAFKSELFSRTDGMPIIRIRDVGKTNTETFYSGSFDDEYVVKPGDLLVGMDGDFRCAFWKGPVALLNQRVCRIMPSNGDVNPKWLHYQLQPFLDEIHKHTSSVTVKHLSSRTINDIPILFPEKGVQDEIVQKIEELFSELDHAEGQLLKARKQLEAYRRSVLKYALEGHYLSDKPNPQVVPLNQISTAVSGFAFKSEGFKEKGRYQVVRMGNVKTNGWSLDDKRVFVNDITNDVLQKTLLRKGDLVITLTGTRTKRDYGNVALVTEQDNLLLNQRLALLRFNNDCNPRFYYYILQTDAFRDQFFAHETGNVGQGNVGIKALKDTTVWKIPLPIQDQIVNDIEQRLSRSDHTIKTIQNQVLHLHSLRQTILSKAFTGQLI